MMTLPKQKAAPDRTDEFTRRLGAIAEHTRLQILLALDAGPKTVNEIVRFFHLSQPTITRHLQTLAEAGLVRRKKEGQTAHYSLAPNVLRDMCIKLVTCFPCCCMTVESGANGVKSASMAKRKMADKKPDRKTTRKPAARTDGAHRGAMKPQPKRSHP